jgi:putative phage-type endonuclease
MNPHCVIVELQQGTPEWQEWRHRGIGSSDASIIMVENRFKSGADLLREKRGPARDFGQNEAMARGIDIEPEARSRYAAKTGRTVEPACLQSTRYDWLRASVDGLASTCDAVVEIKCGRSNYVRVFRSRCVPHWHRGQLQHILAVTGFDSVDFWCHSPGCDGLLLSVERDNVYIECLLDRELKFWNEVRRTA